MITCADVANAVTVDLDGNTWSKPFTARRVYVPMVDLADLATLTVLVVAKNFGIGGAETRGHVRDEFDVDVGVMQRLEGDPTDPATNDEIDQLLAMVKEIAQFFRPGYRAGETEAYWTATSNDPIYDPDKLLREKVFQSVLTVSFRLLRTST